MTLASRLERSLKGSVIAAAMGGSLAFILPKALMLWHLSLAISSARACEKEGGVALMGGDVVVSCAPKTRASKAVP
jgi:hypothetical protein